MKEENVKLDFFDASRIVAGTKRAVRILPGGLWRLFRYETRGTVALVARDAPNDKWWPTPNEMKEKCWQVEPEKPREVFVYLEHDGEGTGAFRFDDQTGYYTIPSDIKLPKIESQKFRLVPADETWPWRKFEPDEMPRKKFRLLALMRDGCIWVDDWVNGPPDRDLWRTDGLDMALIDYYIPFDEITKPELNDA